MVVTVCVLVYAALAYRIRQVLQDHDALHVIMKDGEFHRAPPLRSARTMTRWAA